MKWIPWTAGLVLSLTTLSAGAEPKQPSGKDDVRDKVVATAEASNPPAEKEEPDFLDQDLRIQVDASYKGLKGSADFLVHNAVQSNQVASSVRKLRSKTAQKEWGFIANLLPVVDPNDPDVVSLQMQIELSGPGEAPDEDTSTWRLVTECKVKKGVKRVIANAAGKLEVTVSDAPLAGPNLWETPR